MKALSYLLLLVSMAVFLTPWACTKTLVTPVSAIATATPTFTPTAANTPTVTVSAPVTLSVINTGSYQYSVFGSGVALTAPLTVAAGQFVVFDTSNNGHPLYIDNGSGTCNITGQTSFPYFYSVSGLAGTQYTFHCGIHGLCGGTSSTICTLPCTGMTGVIHVQ